MPISTTGSSYMLMSMLVYMHMCVEARSPFFVVDTHFVALLWNIYLNLQGSSKYKGSHLGIFLYKYCIYHYIIRITVLTQ